LLICSLNYSDRSYLVILKRVFAADVEAYRVSALLLNKVESTTKKVEKLLGPIIIEGLEKDAKFGPNWEGRPVSTQRSSLLGWLAN
jgi:hypothetical protein